MQRFWPPPPPIKSIKDLEENTWQESSVSPNLTFFISVFYLLMGKFVGIWSLLASPALPPVYVHSLPNPQRTQRFQPPIPLFLLFKFIYAFSSPFSCTYKFPAGPLCTPICVPIHASLTSFYPRTAYFPGAAQSFSICTRVSGHRLDRYIMST